MSEETKKLASILIDLITLIMHGDGETKHFLELHDMCLKIMDGA